MNKNSNCQKFVKALLWLLRPPNWFIYIACPCVFAVVGVQLAVGGGARAAEYAVYTLSAYCLAVWVVNFPSFIKSAKAAAKRPAERFKVINTVKSTRFGESYFNSAEFRAGVSVFTGLAVDILYTIFRAIAGISNKSVWFVSMAVYYLVLAALRGNICVCLKQRQANESRKQRLWHTQREWYCYRRTGALLLVLNIPMGGMIVLMVTTNSGYQYAGYIIYLSALYTFYMVARSIVNLFKFRKIGSPALSAAKTVDFTSALMSLLGLQTALISRFSDDGEKFRVVMNSITGGFVFAGATALAVYMLIESARQRNAAADENGERADG